MIAAAPAFEQILSVPLTQLHESPTNTRRTWGNLDELAASFREVGILQPLVARARPAEEGGYELVFGHRRLRAAKKAKLNVVPVIVRVMGDAQAQEAQVVENLQRTDLHALEEAEAFEQLHRLGWSAEDMAAKIGKSRAYVFARMKLLELGPEGREAFYAGTLTASVALYLARVPASLQSAALEDLEKEARDRGGSFGAMKGATTEVEPLSARDASDLLHDRYMLRLADSPFDRGDAELVARAGSCKDCPKRSGNQKELFGDVPSPDVCTDPTCFAEKKTATAAGVAAKLEKRGVRVLDGKTKAHGRVQTPAGYVKLDDYCPEAGKTYGELVTKIEKRAPRTPSLKVVHERTKTMMLDEKNKPVELVKRADVVAAAGLEEKAEKRRVAGTDDGWSSPENVLKRKATELGDAAAIAVIAAKAEAAPWSDAMMRAFIGRVDSGIAERRGWKLPKARWAAHDYPELQKLKGDALRGLLTEVIVSSLRDEEWAAVCAAFKVDSTAIVAEELAKLKAAAKEEKPTEPPARDAKAMKRAAKKAR